MTTLTREQDCVSPPWTGSVDEHWLLDGSPENEEEEADYSPGIAVEQLPAVFTAHIKEAFRVIRMQEQLNELRTQFELAIEAWRRVTRDDVTINPSSPTLMPSSPQSDIATGNRDSESLIAAVRHVARLLSLPPDWDSYGAKPIDRQNAVAVLRLVWEATAIGAPPPAIVPTSDGSIQLEWHRRGVDLEIKALSGTSFEIFFEDLSTGETSETEIGNDLSPLRAFLGRVTD